MTMIVRGPGVPAGQTQDQLVGNVDLAPTWADLAGAAVPSFIDGRSLLPLMRPSPPGLGQWRQVYSIENGPDNGVPAQSETETVVADTNLLEPLDADQLPPTAQAPSSGKKAKGEVVPALRGLRTQTLSYVEYVTGETELYDLTKDPYELTNLVSTADPKLLAALSARVKLLESCQAADCRTVEDAPLNLP